MKGIKVLLAGLFFLSLFASQPPSAQARVPGNGIVREYYPDGTLQREDRYKNKQLIRRRQYSKAGLLLLDFRYKEGEPFYKRESYPDGRIRYLWTKKSGVLINYNHDGTVKVIVKSAKKNIESP
jgi:hypothetical protein